ncbi:MAG: acetoacetate--CoA ligase [Actinomycetia bacterium]|nr:acetoacetate--CoA ligase [Actinomycetes bacterium]
MRPIAEGDLLWSPAEGGAGSRLEHYRAWLRETRGLAFRDYDELWSWSVSDLEAFWVSMLDYFELETAGSWSPVLTSHELPGARWFSNLELNYAREALRQRDERPAILAIDEAGRRRSLTNRELADAVAAAAAGLRRLGVRSGDRVVAYLPNVSEAVVGFLASASLGAIWSLCSPDLGSKLVLDRFSQIEPKVLIASSAYTYGGRSFDRSDAVREIVGGLPTLTTVVNLGDAVPVAASSVSWDSLCAEPTDLFFESVTFEHPLWIVYTSGTTGLPKPIVHGHGGIAIELHKLLALHFDLGPGDTFFWLTSSGWVMWNILGGGMLRGSTIVLYDGHPGYPGPERLWQLVAEERVTYFGVGAAFLHGALKARLRPRDRFDLSRLRGVGSTASPLSVAGFEWVHRHVGEHVSVGSTSGGTDVVSAFVGPCPTLPVHAGEIQCRCLGVKAEAYDAAGAAVIDEVGELVIEKPMPSMPVFFWNDPDGTRYRQSYFDQLPGRWTHGDWVRFTTRGSCVVYGRSDATLNRGGIRLGTRDYYELVESLEAVENSLVIDTSELGAEGLLLLFVALVGGKTLDAELEGRLGGLIRRELSPRHRPDVIRQVSAIPVTLTGKKLEIPVKRLLSGVAPEEAVSRSAIANPEALDEVLEIARGVLAQRR